MAESRRRASPRAGGACVVALILATSGCTAFTAPPGYAGMPTRPGEELAVHAPGDGVLAWADGDRLVVTTMGSGSCPAVPEVISRDDTARTVTVEVAVPGRTGACTADSAPRTFELDAGGDVSGFAVEVVSGDD